MCWNQSISTLFTITESTLIIFLFIRSRLSHNKWVRSQWLLLPSLLGICIMEGIEAYIWSLNNQLSLDSSNEYHPLLLQSIQETTGTTTSKCDKWNSRLTTFTWLFILPWQPLWVIFPCRRVGSTKNKILLYVPEVLAILFGLSNTFFWVLTTMFIDNDNNDNEQSQQQLLYLQSLQESYYKSYLHTETCTYIGLSGQHLHWSYRFPNTFITPNAFTYALLWFSIIVTKPKRFAAGIYLIALGIFIIQLIYFQLSFEAGSVWCWSAIFIFIYFIIQPYIFPCNNDDNYDEKEVEEVSGATKS